MKQHILRAGSAIYDFIKSPIGLAVSGGIAGSATTFFFDRSNIERKLVQAQFDNQQLNNRLLTLENVNSVLCDQNGEISLINKRYAIASEEIRAELRHAVTDVAMLKEQLKQCHHTVNVYESSMRNSLFFGKNDVYNNQDEMTKTEANPMAASLSKK